MARYTLVNGSNIVENVTTWDGIGEFNPPNVTLYLIEDNALCVGGEGIGPGCIRNSDGTYTYAVPAVPLNVANKQALLQRMPAAMAELDQIITRGNTFLAQANYSVANAAQAQTAINDLLSKLKSIVGGIPADGSGGLMAVARDCKALIRLAAGILDDNV